jgi:hypothetical protein
MNNHQAVCNGSEPDEKQFSITFEPKSNAWVVVASSKSAQSLPNDEDIALFARIGFSEPGTREALNECLLSFSYGEEKVNIEGSRFDYTGSGLRLSGLLLGGDTIVLQHTADPFIYIKFKVMALRELFELMKFCVCVPAEKAHTSPKKDWERLLQSSYETWLKIADIAESYDNMFPATALPQSSERLGDKIAKIKRKYDLD